MSKYTVLHIHDKSGRKAAVIVEAATHVLVAGPFFENPNAPEGLGGDNIYDDDNNVVGFIDDYGRVTV